MSQHHLASRVLQQLSEDNQDELPRASSVAGKFFYIDHCITGAPTVQDAISLQQDLVTLMAKGKMTLRKWRSNHPDVMAAIPPDLRDSSELSLTIKYPSDCNTTLGIRWNTTEDQFFLVVPQVDDSFMPIMCSSSYSLSPRHSCSRSPHCEGLSSCMD